MSAPRGYEYLNLKIILSDGPYVGHSGTVIAMASTDTCVVRLTTGQILMVKMPPLCAPPGPAAFAAPPVARPAQPSPIDLLIETMRNAQLQEARLSEGLAGTTREMAALCVEATSCHQPTLGFRASIQSRRAQLERDVDAHGAALVSARAEQDRLLFDQLTVSRSSMDMEGILRYATVNDTLEKLRAWEAACAPAAPVAAVCIRVEAFVRDLGLPDDCLEKLKQYASRDEAACLRFLKKERGLVAFSSEQQRRIGVFASGSKASVTSTSTSTYRTSRSKAPAAAADGSACEPCAPKTSVKQPYSCAKCGAPVKKGHVCLVIDVRAVAQGTEAPPFRPGLLDKTLSVDPQRFFSHVVKPDVPEEEAYVTKAILAKLGVSSDIEAAAVREQRALQDPSQVFCVTDAAMEDARAALEQQLSKPRAVTTGFRIARRAVAGAARAVRFVFNGKKETEREPEKRPRVGADEVSPEKRWHGEATMGSSESRDDASEEDPSEEDPSDDDDDGGAFDSDLDDTEELNGDAWDEEGELIRKTVVVSGTVFGGLSRKRVESLLRRRGAYIVSQLSSEVDYLVLGDEDVGWRKHRDVFEERWANLKVIPVADVAVLPETRWRSLVAPSTLREATPLEKIAAFFTTPEETAGRCRKARCTDVNCRRAHICRRHYCHKAIALMPHRYFLYTEDARAQMCLMCTKWVRGRADKTSERVRRRRGRRAMLELKRYAKKGDLPAEPKDVARYLKEFEAAFRDEHAAVEAVYRELWGIPDTQSLPMLAHVGMVSVGSQSLVQEGITSSICNGSPGIFVASASVWGAKCRQFTPRESKAMGPPAVLGFDCRCSFELGNLMEGPCQRLLWTGPLASLDLLTLFRNPGVGCPKGAPPFQIFIRLTPMRIDENGRPIVPGPPGAEFQDLRGVEEFMSRDRRAA